ncbi:MAG TPA: phosphoserine transaminase [Accumulibacter sp.]|uniref:phosphoserine transaminase n=1 Tax=Accumulibacter sp. TaxID=2053492 RepID=UPI002878CDBC|nr:phosphoserine transaminase [Accumulibacter sp.]MDS4054722.1 phosphoserine transaminase [Accumulibacter sp.]HNB68583.1 phosphoserine transaminase [Accumulibacter sp.]HNG15519.1 phosphoserine transaminase [Accumulibacter sp.]HNG86888.1 phosphoserine transaminase [Accumulibacter sp.]HNH92766.1 phosphoserine transaminase [Accumulibacter sp.]
MQPTVKPKNLNFSSGPCSKRPGYDVRALQLDTLGRSHRSALGKKALGLACSETARILGLPETYRVGVVPGSDTGAVEMALWSLLGARGVDVLAWESFGSGWATDVVKQLKLPNARVLKADYGAIVDLAEVNFDHDVVFTWNGTTSGVRVPNGDWIPAERAGLTICDATSAVFAMDLPWDKLDVVTFSWQKVLGGEGAHGMLILGPRAVERLESYTPPWPLPKVFRLTSAGKLSEGIFRGETINTPSMLCVADYLDALNWIESIGGVPAAIARSEANLRVIADFVAANAWISFLAADPATRSNTSVCLSVDLSAEQVKKMVKLLDSEGVAYDIGSYKDAPAGIRIWCGATIETSDLAALMPWLAWAYAQVSA